MLVYSPKGEDYHYASQLNIHTSAVNDNIFKSTVQAAYAPQVTELVSVHHPKTFVLFRHSNNELLYFNTLLVNLSGDM